VTDVSVIFGKGQGTEYEKGTTFFPQSQRSSANGITIPTISPLGFTVTLPLL